MAAKFCAICGELLKDGTRVELVISATYRDIKSDVHWALDPSDLDPYDDSLVHKVCAEEEHDLYFPEGR